VSLRQEDDLAAAGRPTSHRVIEPLWISACHDHMLMKHLLNPASRAGPDPKEGSVHLWKMAPLGGVAVLAASLLAACGGNNDTGNAAAGGGSAAPCPLVDAADPGNATAPATVPTADQAPKMAKKPTYRVAFSQNASNNPWRQAETASMSSMSRPARRGACCRTTDAITPTGSSSSSARCAPLRRSGRAGPQGSPSPKPSFPSSIPRPGAANADPSLPRPDPRNPSRHCDNNSAMPLSPAFWRRFCVLLPVATAALATVPATALACGGSRLPHGQPAPTVRSRNRR